MSSMKKRCDMQFRSAVTQDAEAILALWKAADAVESVTDTVEDVRRMAARDNAAFIVAISSDQLIGSVIGAFDGWRGNIYRLAVHPAHRRQGIARALVSAIENVFAEWGVKRVSAIVVKEHSWAVEFWQAAGYKMDERVARYVRNLGGHKEAQKA